MSQNLKLNNKNYYFFSYTVSLAIHVVILLFFFIFLKKGTDNYLGKVIDVQMIQGENTPSNSDNIIKEKIRNIKVEKAPDKNDVKEEPRNEESENQNKTIPPANPEANSHQISDYYNFDGSGNDTTGLEQIYAEKTLNVKIKYPVGWTFVDQDSHNKLDGVTFWAGNGIFNPPPYIFLEVKEKYLFNPSKYEFNTKLENSTAYYNSPEELEGQVSQVFYIRTDTDQDFSIKLIMNGKDTFIAFQPIFFGMIKSFNFGKSLF
ncbi:MAG: hypothetical protein P4L35_05905 [Ignavibacteriaceae bacterium]|nr:hypothetical protein [Ignavibacteriaceae bacterium]